MDRVEVERMAHTIHMLMHWAVLAWQTLPYPPRNIPNEVVNLFDRGNDDDFGPDAPDLPPRAKAKAKAGRPALKQMNVESLDVATTLMFLNRASGSPAEGTGRSHLKYPLSSGFRRRDGGGR